MNKQRCDYVKRNRLLSGQRTSAAKEGRANQRQASKVTLFEMVATSSADQGADRADQAGFLLQTRQVAKDDKHVAKPNSYSRWSAFQANFNGRRLLSATQSKTSEWKASAAATEKSALQSIKQDSRAWPQLQSASGMAEGSEGPASSGPLSARLKPHGCEGQTPFSDRQPYNSSKNISQTIQLQSARVSTGKARVVQDHLAGAPNILMKQHQHHARELRAETGTAQQDEHRRQAVVLSGRLRAEAAPIMTLGFRKKIQISRAANQTSRFRHNPQPQSSPYNTFDVGERVKYGTMRTTTIESPGPKVRIEEFSEPDAEQGEDGAGEDAAQASKESKQDEVEAAQASKKKFNINDLVEDGLDQAVEDKAAVPNSGSLRGEKGGAELAAPASPALNIELIRTNGKAEPLQPQALSSGPWSPGLATLDRRSSQNPGAHPRSYSKQGRMLRKSPHQQAHSRQQQARNSKCQDGEAKEGKPVALKKQFRRGESATVRGSPQNKRKQGETVSKATERSRSAARSAHSRSKGKPSSIPTTTKQAASATPKDEQLSQGEAAEARTEAAEKEESTLNVQVPAAQAWPDGTGRAPPEPAGQENPNKLTSKKQSHPRLKSTDRSDPAGSKQRVAALAEGKDSELEQERLAIENSLLRFEEIKAENLEVFDPDDSLMSLGLGLGIKVPKHLSNKARIKSAGVPQGSFPIGGAGRGRRCVRMSAENRDADSPENEQAAESQLNKLVKDVYARPEKRRQLVDEKNDQTILKGQQISYYYAKGLRNMSAHNRDGSLGTVRGLVSSQPHLPMSPTARDTTAGGQAQKFLISTRDMLSKKTVETAAQGVTISQKLASQKSATGSLRASGVKRLKSANPGTARAIFQGGSRRQLALGWKSSRQPLVTEEQPSGRRPFQSAHNKMDRMVNNKWLRSSNFIRGSDAVPSGSVVNLLTWNPSLKELPDGLQKETATARGRNLWAGRQPEQLKISQIQENDGTLNTERSNQAALAGELANLEERLSPKCSTQYKDTVLMQSQRGTSGPAIRPGSKYGKRLPLQPCMVTSSGTPLDAKKRSRRQQIAAAGKRMGSGEAQNLNLVNLELATGENSAVEEAEQMTSSNGAETQRTNANVPLGSARFETIPEGPVENELTRVVTAVPETSPSKCAGKLRQNKEVGLGGVIPRLGPESTEPAAAQDIRIKESDKGTSKTFRHQPETVQTLSAALEALGDNCRTIESGLIMKQEPQNRVEAEPADTMAHGPETLQQFEEQSKIPLLPSQPPSVPLGELSPVPGTGQASGQMSPPLNSYQWFHLDEERKQLQSLQITRQQTQGSDGHPSNEALRTEQVLQENHGVDRQRSYGKSASKHLVLSNRNSTTSRRSVLKKFGRSWEFDAGSSQGGGCKMFAHPAQYQEMKSSAPFNSQEGSAEMNILNNYTGSGSAANFIEVQDHMDEQAPAGKSSPSKKPKDSATYPHQKRKQHRSTALAVAARKKDPYVMLSGLLDQLDEKEKSTTFVLPNRQQAEGVQSVEQHLDKGRDLLQIRGEIRTKSMNPLRSTNKAQTGGGRTRCLQQPVDLNRGIVTSHRGKPIRFKHATGFKVLTLQEIEAVAAKEEAEQLAEVEERLKRGQRAKSVKEAASTVKESQCAQESLSPQREAVRPREFSNRHPILVVSRMQDGSPEERKALSTKRYQTLMDVVMSQPQSAVVGGSLERGALESQFKEALRSLQPNAVIPKEPQTDGVDQVRLHLVSPLSEAGDGVFHQETAGQVRESAQLTSLLKNRPTRQTSGNKPSGAPSRQGVPPYPRYQIKETDKQVKTEASTRIKRPKFGHTTQSSAAPETTQTSGAPSSSKAARQGRHQGKKAAKNGAPEPQDPSANKTSTQINQFLVLFNDLNNDVPANTKDQKHHPKHQKKDVKHGPVQDHNFANRFLSQAEKALTHPEKRTAECSPKAATEQSNEAPSGEDGAVLVLKSQKCPVFTRESAVNFDQETLQAQLAIQAQELKNLGALFAEGGIQMPLPAPLPERSPRGPHPVYNLISENALPAAPVSKPNRLAIPRMPQQKEQAHQTESQSPTPTAYTPGRPALRPNFPNNMPTVEYKSQQWTAKSRQVSGSYVQQVELSEGTSPLHMPANSMRSVKEASAARPDRQPLGASSPQHRTQTKLQQAADGAPDAPPQPEQLKHHSQFEVRPMMLNIQHKNSGQRVQNLFRVETDLDLAQPSEQLKGLSHEIQNPNAAAMNANEYNEQMKSFGLKVQSVAKNRGLVIEEGGLDLQDEIEEDKSVGPATLGSRDRERDELRSSARKVLYSNRASLRGGIAHQDRPAPASPREKDSTEGHEAEMTNTRLQEKLNKPKESVGHVLFVHQKDLLA